MHSKLGYTLLALGASGFLVAALAALTDLDWRLRLSINEYHRWLRWPIFKMYQFGK